MKITSGPRWILKYFYSITNEAIMYINLSILFLVTSLGGNFSVHVP